MREINPFFIVAPSLRRKKVIKGTMTSRVIIDPRIFEEEMKMSEVFSPISSCLRYSEKDSDKFSFSRAGYMLFSLFS